MNLKNTTKYDDIIHLPHHISKTRTPMPVSDRAAQFSPFAALTGHETAIKETARLTDKRIELDESQKSILNEKLQIIAERLKNHPEVGIVYFVPDEKKEGGHYIRTNGRLKKIEERKRMLIMEDGTRIAIDEIVEIEDGYCVT